MTTISEKRANETDDVYYKANVVLVDIEGTTTSIDFVKNTLFPYVRKNLEVYLKSKWNDDEFKEDLKLLQEQSKQDEADGIEGLVKIPEGFSEDICEDVKKNVLWQMDFDRKTKALKQLQGHIWRDAYNKGDVKAHVYPDVVPALKSWKQSGKDIYVYSSGSVEAQKLLFGHTHDGDLLELFSGYFDTTVGPKVEESSYSNIVNSVKCKSEEIIFFTDVPKEARAAKSAGLQAVIVVREGNLPITDDDKLQFPVIKSFDDIVFESSVKRRKKSEEQPLEQGKTNSAVVEVSSVEDVEMKEEPSAVKTETSKLAEGVSSTEKVEAVNKQPTPGEPCATSEEPNQTNCKEKDTVNNELVSTKETGGDSVSDKGAAEVAGQNEANSKTLEVNGAENLDAVREISRTESNGPKCPKDNISESDINLPVSDNVVVPDAKTDINLTDNDKTKVNDKTEKCEHDDKSGSPVPTGKASRNSITDSKANVKSVTDKTECTHSEKTENVCEKTESTTVHNIESALVCKTESVKPNDTESATKKTDSELNKAEPMETDLTCDLKNKDDSPATKEVKVDVALGENETPTGPADSKETTDRGKPEAVGESTPDGGKAAAEAASGDSTVVAAAEANPDSGKVDDAAVEANPDSGKVDAAAEATPDGDKAVVEATLDSNKVETAMEATPSSGEAAVETTAHDSKVEVAGEATTDAGKVEAAAEATTDAGKVEAAAEATTDAVKVEDAAEATTDAGKVEDAAEATTDAGKVEAAAEATTDAGKVEAAAEATTDAGKVEAAAEATTDAGKVEAAAEATTDAGKVEAAAEATTDAGKVEAAAEATTDAGKVEAAAEATTGAGKVETAVEAATDAVMVDTATEATTGGKVEAAVEATTDADMVEAAVEATPDAEMVEAAAEATPDKVEAVAKATTTGDKADVSAVTSDVKADNAASAVTEVKVDNKTDTPMEDAEPMVTDEAEQMSTNKDNTKVKSECEPMVTDDGDPMATDEKTITEGAKNSSTNESEPMVTEDIEPMVTDAEPIGTSKDETVNNTENSDGEKPKTAQPVKDEKTKEESNECTKNVPTDSSHVNDSTNCNSVNKDVPVEDTRETASAGNADAAAAEKGSVELNSKTESNTENKSKSEDKNVADNVKEVENEVGKNSVNSCVENGESKEKTDNTNEKLKIAAETTDKVVDNVVST